MAQDSSQDTAEDRLRQLRENAGEVVKILGDEKSRTNIFNAVVDGTAAAADKGLDYLNSMAEGAKNTARDAGDGKYSKEAIRTAIDAGAEKLNKTVENMSPNEIAATLAASRINVPLQIISGMAGSSSQSIAAGVLDFLNPGGAGKTKEPEKKAGIMGMIDGWFDEQFSGLSQIGSFFPDLNIGGWMNSIKAAIFSIFQSILPSFGNFDLGGIGKLLGMSGDDEDGGANVDEAPETPRVDVASAPTQSRSRLDDQKPVGDEFAAAHDHAQPPAVDPKAAPRPGAAPGITG
ncbi:MAG: hypothetical protein KDI46_03550 [Alphaproteobacteria bacterium]|nr:hypothetical protein [Alphaproteobacteria bacterium]